MTEGMLTSCGEAANVRLLLISKAGLSLQQASAPVGDSCHQVTAEGGPTEAQRLPGTSVSRNALAPSPNQLFLVTLSPPPSGLGLLTVP